MYLSSIVSGDCHQRKRLIVSICRPRHRQVDSTSPHVATAKNDERCFLFFPCSPYHTPFPGLELVVPQTNRYAEFSSLGGISSRKPAHLTFIKLKRTSFVPWKYASHVSRCDQDDIVRSTISTTPDGSWPNATRPASRGDQLRDSITGTPWMIMASIQFTDWVLPKLSLAVALRRPLSCLTDGSDHNEGKTAVDRSWQREA